MVVSFGDALASTRTCPNQWSKSHVLAKSPYFPLLVKFLIVHFLPHLQVLLVANILRVVTLWHIVDHLDFSRSEFRLRLKLFSDFDNKPGHYQLPGMRLHG